MTAVHKGAAAYSGAGTGDRRGGLSEMRFGTELGKYLAPVGVAQHEGFHRVDSHHASPETWQKVDSLLLVGFPNFIEGALPHEEQVLTSLSPNRPLTSIILRCHTNHPLSKTLNLCSVCQSKYKQTCYSLSCHHTNLI